MKKYIVIFGITLSILVCTLFIDLSNYKLKLNNELNVEVNSDITNAYFVKEIANGTILNLDEKVDTSKIGPQDLVLKILDKFNSKKDYTIRINVYDDKAPIIEGVKDYQTNIGKDIDILEFVTVSDNSKENIKIETEGNYDINTQGAYPITLKATDSSGNTTQKTMIVTVLKEEKNPYYIKINRAKNVVKVYGLDADNNYSKLLFTYICSTGDDTPLGSFQITDKERWLQLVNGEYGQYTSRIIDSIWFHSVPYKEKTKDSLEWEEYNKLGTKASLGCIRMSVLDSKWIYDNCTSGTVVEIYDDSNEEIETPTTIKIEESNPNKGWDPTDPDPENPWN